eukprot:gb/GECG01009033.1/.p1 GENE.gb/GECG01009033.1/~~gb/GECG01009033.1/.p1  ORF type:complete len:106 (+),score=4.06 gb/GECG01009033.1/:1-318(+)
MRLELTCRCLSFISCSSVLSPFVFVPPFTLSRLRVVVKTRTRRVQKDDRIILTGDCIWHHTTGRQRSPWGPGLSGELCGPQPQLQRVNLLCVPTMQRFPSSCMHQ